MNSLAHPIGIIPKRIWDEQRYIALDNAIYRFENSEHEALAEWYVERTDFEKVYPRFKDLKSHLFENPLRKV